MQQLQDALLDAFPSEDELRQLLFRMGLPPSAVPVARSLAVMMLDVIEYATSRGLLEKTLLPRACELRPQHQRLHDVVQRYWPGLLPEAPVAAPDRAEAAPERRRQNELSRSDWQNLVRYIRDKKCTPVIGPGACHGALPDAVALAGSWADECGYPFPDRTDLARVAQFLALTDFPLSPHERIHDLIVSKRQLPSDVPDNPCEPHRLLAELDLPLYLTTNYDDAMLRALAERRKPTRAFPCWNRRLADQASPDAAPAATPDSPLVYHLFGHHEIPESMVLTEDDHFTFLASVADPKLLPPVVKRALGGTSLLFLGYEVLDWRFRVLVRALLECITADNGRLGVAVQLPAELLSAAQREQVELYLAKFLENVDHIHFKVFWGDTHEFTRMLHDKWEEQRRHAAAS